MLDKLSPELILKISTLLTLQDKLALITTCRLLFNLISKTNLYSELDLIKHREKVEEIIDKFSSSRYPGSQVRKLSFSIKKMPGHLLHQLPAIFPNITQATTRHRLGFARSLADYSKCPIMNWSKTLEVFKISSDWIELLPLLKTTTFPRLTELELGQPFDLRDKNEGFDIPYFLPHLKNAPALKKLALTFCAIDLEFMEEVHTSCPYLESLVLCYTHIVIKNDKLLQPIIPAGSMLYLEITHPLCFDTKGLFLDYITSKYRCLKKLQLVFDAKLYHSFSFNKYYTRFNINHPVINGADNTQERQEYIRMYNSLKNEFNRTLAVYEQSGTRFFSNLTPSIESINIGRDPFDNTIEALATSDTKLATLNYTEQLKKKDQIRHITNIKYLKTLIVHIVFPEQWNFQMVPSTSVTKLILTSYGCDTTFDRLLQMFPSLKDFTLYGGCWTISDNEGYSTARFPDLWKLKASVSILDQKCLDFLTKSIPNLKVLDVYTSNRRPVTSDMSIDISGWELRELRLAFDSINFMANRYFNIKTPYFDQIIKCNLVGDTVELLKDRANIFTGAKPPMINITSTNDKSFLFFRRKLSLMQKEITVT